MIFEERREGADCDERPMGAQLPPLLLHLFLEKVDSGGGGWNH